jgi:hypothetical protein
MWHSRRIRVSSRLIEATSGGIYLQYSAPHLLCPPLPYPSLCFIYIFLPAHQRSASQTLGWVIEIALVVPATGYATSHDSTLEGDPAMQDLTMLVFTAIFFCGAFLYVKACQKLR